MLQAIIISSEQTYECAVIAADTVASAPESTWDEQ